jgi:hypothetical protein
MQANSRDFSMFAAIPQGSLWPKPPSRKLTLWRKRLTFGQLLQPLSGVVSRVILILL